MKYKDWLGEWLALCVKPSAKTSTYEKYRRLAIKHIIPTLGDVEASDLSTAVLQKFTMSLSGKNLSANTINGIISVLKSSLRRAVLMGIADKEFTSAIVCPKHKEKQISCFSKEEQRLLEHKIEMMNKLGRLLS